MTKEQTPQERKPLSSCCNAELQFNGAVFFCSKCNKVNVESFRLALGGKSTHRAIKDAEARSRRRGY